MRNKCEFILYSAHLYVTLYPDSYLILEQNHHHEALSRKNFGTKIQFFHVITKEIHQKLPVTRSKPSVIKSKPLN